MAGLITHPRFFRLDQMTVAHLRALDRARTVALLPVGMLEEHGQHLPMGTDTFAVDALTVAAASWLLDTEPNLNVLLMPTITYGTAPIDERRPELFADAGSVWIGRDTLKAMVRDVAGHMLRYGFRYIFPLTWHGGPDQSRALKEVCDELRAANPGAVVYEPVGYVLAGAEPKASPGLATLLGRPLTAQEEVALQGSVHASMFETSVMLHLRSGLVDQSYRHLRTIEWQQMFKMSDWPGYVGAAPAHANAEIGGAVLRWRGVRAASLIRRAINGEDLSSLIRHPRWESEDSLGIQAAELDASRHPPEHTVHDESKPVMHISRERLHEGLHEEYEENNPDPGGDVTRPGSATPH